MVRSMGVRVTDVVNNEGTTDTEYRCLLNPDEGIFHGYQTRFTRLKIPETTLPVYHSASCTHYAWNAWAQSIQKSWCSFYAEYAAGNWITWCPWCISHKCELYSYWRTKGCVFDRGMPISLQTIGGSLVLPAHHCFGCLVSGSTWVVVLSDHRLASRRFECARALLTNYSEVVRYHEWNFSFRFGWFDCERRQMTRFRFKWSATVFLLAISGSHHV